MLSRLLDVMRKRASWMKPADDPILEYVRDAGEVNPAVIARNTDLHRKYVSRRCGTLAEYGLFEALGEGYYRITETGTRYLNEEIDADELETDRE